VEIPTEDELDQIEALLRADPAVTRAELQLVITGRISLRSEKARKRIYDLEARIMDLFPHLRFDFSTVVPDELRRGDSPSDEDLARLSEA